MSNDDAARVFCSVRAPILDNDLAFAISIAGRPTPGHALILTRRHVANYFDATPDERAAILTLLMQMKRRTDETLAPDRYTVGVNVGVAAGQTVVHVHMHLIPRIHGDSPDPGGGVRAVIRERQRYP